MGRFAVLWLLVTGCSGLFGLDSPVHLDATDDDAPPPGDDAAFDGASNCYGRLPICLTSMPADRSIGAMTINTGTACDLVVDQATTGAPQLCVLLGRNVLVTGAVKAVGARPLTIVATETLSITSTGSIDVSSRTANPTVVGAGASAPGCTGNNGTNSNNADAGGGAGGSFQGSGGDGGNGDVAGGTAAMGLVVPPAFVQGGCKGFTGGIASGALAYDGGDSGGAVYLVAGKRIDVTGDINASGGGGKGGAIGGNGNSGGSGGGSGGMIRFDAPMVMGAGKVFANGGGGGGASSSAVPGGTGGTSGDPAQGGAAGGSSGAGVGGQGSAGSNLGGAGGASTSFGGGGGGGGAGYIQVFAPQADLTGLVSPPAIMM